MSYIFCYTLNLSLCEHDAFSIADFFKFAESFVVLGKERGTKVLVIAVVFATVTIRSGLRNENLIAYKTASSQKLFLPLVVR